MRLSPRRFQRSQECVNLLLFFFQWFGEPFCIFCIHMTDQSCIVLFCIALSGQPGNHGFLVYSSVHDNITLENQNMVPTVVFFSTLFTHLRSIVLITCFFGAAGPLFLQHPYYIFCSAEFIVLQHMRHVLHHTFGIHSSYIIL